MKRMKAVSDKFVRFFYYVLEKQMVRRDADDFVDMLLKLADDPEIDVKLSTDMIKGIVQVSVFMSYDSHVS